MLEARSGAQPQAAEARSAAAGRTTGRGVELALVRESASLKEADDEAEASGGSVMAGRWEADAGGVSAAATRTRMA